MISLPPSRQWTQKNNGEVFGSLFSTRNINFDEQGYLKLARKSVAMISGVSNFGAIKSIDYVTNAGTRGYYFMTDGHPFMYDPLSPTSLVDLNGTGHTGGAGFDGLIWQNRWYVSQDTNFAYLFGTWTTGLGTLTAGNVHPLCVFENLNNLAIGDGNQVHLYDTSHTIVKSLVLPLNFEVRWMVWKNNNLYIGTRNISGGKAFMFLWSATSTAADFGYQVDDAWIFSGCAYKSTIAIMTSNGELQEFNGGGFDVLAVLPIYYNSASWYNGNGFTFGRMAHRGMIADGDMIYLNLDTHVEAPDPYLVTSPAGLWQYDPNVGLYHKAGWSTGQYYHFSNFDGTFVNTSTDTITTSANFTCPTGTLVGYQGDIAGLAVNSTGYYFMIRLSASTFKLASTYANAINSIAIDLTSSGSTYHFDFSENDEYGKVYSLNPEPAALALVSHLDINVNSYEQINESVVLFGNAQADNNQLSSNMPVLNSLAKGYNIGSFVTQKIYSEDITDTFGKIVEKFSKFNETCDQFIMKYRSAKRANMPVIGISSAAVWTNGTTFTTTKDLSSVKIGDEVEIINGRCSGYNSHILNVSLSSGTYTVVIDETLPNVSSGDKSDFVIDNWVKSSKTPVTLATLNNIARQNTQGDKPWIQLKFELRGVSEPTMEEIQVINVPFKQSI